MSARARRGADGPRLVLDVFPGLLPGGGITQKTMRTIAATSGAAELHFASLEPREGRMRHRNPRVFMGGTLRPPEYSQDVTRPESVAAMIAAAGRKSSV